MNDTRAKTRGRNRIFLTMLRGSMGARRGRLALAAGAIAIGTSVAAALLLVSVDVGRKVERELRVYGPNLVLAPAAGELTVGAHELRLGTLGGEPRFGSAALAWLAGETRAGRIASFTPVRYAVARVNGSSLVVAGTDVPSLFALYPAWRKARVLRGAPPAAEPEAWIGARAAARLGVAHGSALTLDLGTHGEPRTLTLGNVGVVEAGGAEDQEIFVSIERLDTALVAPARFHIALARAGGEASSVLAYAAMAAVGAPEGALPTGATLRAIKRLSAADGEVLRRIRLLLVLVTVVALVAAALCAMSTLADLVLERTSEIALLRSLGAGRGDLLTLFLGEAAALGIAGGVVGLAIGFVAAQAIGWGVFGSAIRPTPAVVPITLALGVVTALLASLAPVRDALTIEPARVLRGE